MMNRSTRGRKGLALGAVAALLMASWSMSSQAQTCTIGNWEGGAVAAGQLFAGDPTEGNPRYAGPCSLRVNLANEVAYVVDNSPLAEQSYIARFYFNPNGTGSADRPMVIFAANDADDGTGDDVVQLWFNVASGVPTLDSQPNHVTLVVQTASGPQQIAAGATGVRANGWNSFEIVWSADPAASIRLSVNGADDLVLAGANTSTQRVRSALMGLAGIPDGVTVSAASPMFFDDFDSRRETRPGRLCRGLTDESRDQLLVSDAVAIFGEVSSGGEDLAAGVPDFNEDGVVNITDVVGVFNQISVGQSACDLNS